MRPTSATVAPPGVAYEVRSRCTHAPINWLRPPPRAVACTASVTPTSPMAASTDHPAAR